VLSHRAKPDSTETSLRILNDLSAGDRQFITTLAQDLNLSLAWDEFDDQGRNLISVSFPYTEPDEVLEGEEDGEGEWEDDVDTQESNAAIDRVLTKYSKAKVLNGGAEEFEKREEERLTKMMDDWKREYYRVRATGAFIIHNAPDANLRLIG
jgi:5'-3' exoribonuclease 1